jgi:hypothetical protein
MEGKPIQLFIGIIALTLVACAETGSQVSHQSSLTDMPPITAPTEIAPSLVVTDTLMSATELVPTSTPPPTIQSTPTEILPTPDFIDSPLVDGFLISPSLDSDCQLPCWHGLRVGESDREDVQRMFDETLGFNGMLDFFTEHRLPEVTISTFHLDLPGTQATGHEWAAPPMAGFFGLYMLVDEDTGILQGIQLVLTSSYDTYPYELLSAQQVLRELGTPSSIYARRDFGIPPGRALYLFLIYNDMGIATFLGIYRRRGRL